MSGTNFLSIIATNRCNYIGALYGFTFFSGKSGDHQNFLSCSIASIGSYEQQTSAGYGTLCLSATGQELAVECQTPGSMLEAATENRNAVA